MMCVPTLTEFPWLYRNGCGCSFTRIPLTNGTVFTHWDPCGAHIVQAAEGWQPTGWPPTLAQPARV